MHEAPSSPGLSALTHAKLTYFVMFGAMAAYTPFVPVLLDGLGMSKDQIGIVRLVRRPAPLYVLVCPRGRFSSSRVSG